MKKALAWLLVIAMTAALAVGGTLAYLTDTDEDVNVMTVGKVKIDQLEYEREKVETENEDATVQEFHDNKPLYPAVIEDDFNWTTGDSYVDWEQIGKDGYTSEIWDPSKINNEVDKMVFVKNKGDFDAYVRTVFAFEAGSYETLDEYLADVHFNLNEEDWTWEWSEPPVEIGGGKYFIATATYNKVLEPGALTEISLSQIAMDPSVTNEDVAGFGDTFQVLVQSQAVQADGFEDAPTALNEAFGIIDTAVEPPEIPFENDNPTQGTNLRTALHYLNGDTTDIQITTKVSNIYFAENGAYPEIEENNEGVLVDVDQDVPVYAYYVANGSNYDVYFLSADDIYTPVDSTDLFRGMSALTSIDTTNLNTGRTELFVSFLRDCSKLTQLIGSENWDTGNGTDMSDMIRGCSALTTVVGIENWDISNVTSLARMFYGDKALVSVNLSTWDTGNVTDMYGMFSTAAIVEIDADNWDVSKVVDMKGMFNGCSKLETLKCSNWNTKSIDTFCAMFQGCKSLKNIDVSNWNTATATNMEHMFAGCTSLEVLDVSNWNVSNVKKFNAMFQGGGSNKMDMKIKVLDVSKWEPNSAEYLNHMFYGCAKLTELDMSGWNMPNLYTTSHMMADCINLETIDVSGWKTTSAWYSLDAMFNDCRSVKFLDVSSFNVSGAVELSQIFEACWSLEEIYGMNNWDTSSGKAFDQMFMTCKALKVVDMSSFDTSNAKAGNVAINGDVSKGFSGTFSGMNSLEKLIIGENFCFTGDGSVTAAATLPSPAKIDGQTTLWYNAENDTYYAANEIPEKTAATYIAAVPPANP